MALKSINGTTSQIADAILAGDIGIETSVTITDNLYTATKLLDIIAVTNKTITLTYTAAGTPISEAPADLVSILAQVNKYTGPLTVTGTDTTAEQLNYIAKKTTGKVTATLDEDTAISKATVDALKDVNSSDDITFVPSQILVEGKAALEALVALSKKLPNTEWTTVADFEGTASEVAAIKAALKVVEDAAVTITSGQISAADANALVVASNGDVTATIKDGSVAATLKALKDVDADAQANVLTFTSTDKTADAKALVDLADLVTEDFSSVQTITSKAADIGAGGANVTVALTLASVGNPAVTITGAISAANANAISFATTGKVTATITPDTATVIAGALNNAATTDALNITVNGADASVTELNDINIQTALKVKVDAAKVTAATYAEFENIYVTNKNNFSNLGDENITVTAPTINSAQADIVAKATSKVVTATINGETAASVVTNLKNANAKDEFTIALANAATSAKDLLTLDGKTSVTVNAGAITSAITGTVAEVNKLLDADGVSLASNAAFTLSGTVKAADANYIALNTTGVVKATIAADTAAKLDAALTDVIAHNNQYTLTVNGATASVTELNALAAKTAVAADAIKVDAKEITGTGVELTTLYANVKFDNLGNENVKITDAASITDIGSVLGATTGVVTASATGTAAALVALTNATSGKDALTLKVTNGAGATSAANLLTLDGFTSVKVDATGITNGITGTAAQLKQLVAAKGVEIAKGVDITVNGTPNASDLATILKSTLGTVTAANVTADTAAKLNAALKDANSSDALDLTVNGTTATAKDLISLDGKTNVAIELNVGAITGNIAEITKVFVTDADNFTNEETTDATISGEITAAQADAIADETSGVVTATIKADSAALLNSTLANASGTDALKLTVNGTTADAAHLNALDGKTSVTVNAAAIKNISGDATEVIDAYLANAKKDISGLGNETVDLTGATDANASLVKAINDYTTGVITLPTITFETGVATTFSLNQLGDLKGITGLVGIAVDATNVVKDTINISLKDLLAANDSKNNFTFNVTGAKLANADVVNVTNDVSGWTQTKNIATEHTYTNAKTGQVVTIEADQAVINA